jgi:hypothetical protein
MLPVAPKAEAIDLRAFDTLVGGYRKGGIAVSIDRLAALLSTREGQRRLSEWIDAARKKSQRAEIETLLLLLSDKIMEMWSADDPFPERLLPPYQAALRQAHFALMDIERGTPFLRAWYLLWESFRQSNTSRQLPKPLDFLDDALAEFPRDAEVLLSAGARQELFWTASLENVQRSLSTQPLDVTRLLTAARDFFRRSLAADPNETESRVRLLHVLLELNELTPMQDLIASHDWTHDEPTFRYLANLFEGDMHELRRDFTSATAAYDRASLFSDNP